ncbi:MAG: ATP:cob(I)alamin adenosyltransferase, partial [Thermodesulfobacteriota bacterium]|nr:ATP:cob(I)alamin adenosyltransferase [Thermodesulfobacteriota bacterium]
KSRVLALEEMIQKLETDLPPLSNFILSGSGMLSAHIQFARSLVRTAERQVRSLQLANDNMLPFLNRLSDVLFLIARTTDKRSKQSERLWQGE